METDFEKRFKMCLRALNELITEAKSNCNISLVAVKDSSLLFSNVGNSLMRLVRRESSTNLHTETKSSRFTEIGQGKIAAGDKLILASQAVASNLTSKEITKILTDYPLDDIGGLLESKLDLPKDIAYSYVVVGSERMPELSNSSHQKDQQESPKKYIQTATKLGSSLQRLGSSVSHRGKNASGQIQKSAKSASAKIGPSVTSRTKHGWTSFWSKYINPNPKQAIIVVFITTLIITAMIWGITNFFYNNNQATNKFDQAISLIESAQNNLDKNNSDAAKDNIMKADTILKSLSKEDQTKINQLASQNKIKLDYSTALQRAQAIQDNLTDTTRLNLDDGFEIPQTKLSSLVWTDNNLYGITTTDGSVIEINPLLGSPIARGSNPDIAESISARPLVGGGIVVIGKSGIWQYTPAGGLQQLKVADLPQSTDVASYLGNIYLLSPGENQVIRYAKSGTTLTNRTGLLKNLSADSLASATSLAISGNVFVSGGKEIKLFEQGSERSYELRNIPDSFGDFGKIYQNPDQGYFMILNKDGTRLALLSTESDSASFVRQYALNNNAKIDSFIVEPNNSQLMLSSGNKIVTHKIVK